jgi:predicted transposase YbfD/YdcC
MEDLENVIRKKDDAERQLDALLKLKAELEAEEARKEGDGRDGK